MDEKGNEYGPTNPSLHHEPAGDNTGQPPSSEVVEYKVPDAAQGWLGSSFRSSLPRLLAIAIREHRALPHRHIRNAALPSFPTTSYKPRSLVDPADDLSRDEPVGVSERMMMSNLPSLGLEGGH